ncbi:hypothetical protein OG900_09485 [Streptomyces sp. NBC_00433]
MDVEHLRESARIQMRRSLAAWRLADNDMAVLHAGIGFEHIVKGALAARHPSLLVDGRDFASMLHAAGLGQHASAPEENVKTLGAAEAYKRLRTLMPISITERDVELLLTARNGVAHLGRHDRSQTASALALAVAVADAVLADIGDGGIDFWGPYADGRHALAKMQEEALEEARQEALRAAEFQKQLEGGPFNFWLREIKPIWRQEQEIARGVLSAKMRYAAKLYRICNREKLSASELKKRAKMAEIRVWSKSDEYSTSHGRCAVCGYKLGVLRSRIIPDMNSGSTELLPEMFDCPMCGLELDGIFELSVIGTNASFRPTGRNDPLKSIE